MYDPDERQYLASLRAEAIERAASDPYASAALLKEELGIPRSVRTVQRWIKQVHGTRPSRRSIERRDLLRSRVVAYMVSQGLNERYCSECQSLSLYKGAIREIRRDDSLDSLVFVCRHCATVADV